MKGRCAKVAVCVAVGVALSSVGVYRLLASKPDRFGTLEQVRRVADPGLVAYLTFTGGADKALNDEAVLRATVARGHYAGRSFELDWFVSTLEGAVVPEPEGYQQADDPAFSTVLICLGALGEGWDQAGPYPGVRGRVEGQALRFSAHPVPAVRAWCGAVLTQMERTGSLSPSGTARLEALRRDADLGPGIENLVAYRLVRHRAREAARSPR